VEGCTTGSRGEVPGEREPVIRDDDDNDDGDDKLLPEVKPQSGTPLSYT
jgi:hypothetical protein